MSSEEAKVVVRRYFEEFHNGRESTILERLMAPDLVGPTREATERLLTAFPDYRVTIEDQIAEDDRVATVWTAQGTHRGEWASPAGPVAPTDTAVTWTGTTTLRVADGRIVEVLGTNWDHLGILQQLGVVAPLAARSGA
jgi:predicted ester cyclase